METKEIIINNETYSFVFDKYDNLFGILINGVFNKAFLEYILYWFDLGYFDVEDNLNLLEKIKEFNF